MSKTVLVGFGNVGRTLHAKLERHPKLEAPNLIITSKYVLDNNFEILDSSENFARYTDGTKIAYLTLPSDEDGLTELTYMKHFADRNSAIVTCAKSATAYHYDKIQYILGSMGITACVGGMTGMIPMIRRIRRETVGLPKELVGIINGSLNCAWNQLSIGLPRNRVLYNLISEGLTEQKDFDFMSMIRQELQDARLKATILANESYFPFVHVRPDDLTVSNKLEEIVSRVTTKPKDFRFAVRIVSESKKPSFAGTLFSYESAKCSIEGGFDFIEDLDEELSLRDMNNCLIVYDNKMARHSTSSAPGAGPKYTSSIMIGDALKLLGLL